MAGGKHFCRQVILHDLLNERSNPRLSWIHALTLRWQKDKNFGLCLKYLLIKSKKYWSVRKDLKMSWPQNRMPLECLTASRSDLIFNNI